MKHPSGTTIGVTLLALWAIAMAAHWLGWDAGARRYVDRVMAATPIECQKEYACSVP